MKFEYGYYLVKYNNEEHSFHAHSFQSAAEEFGFEYDQFLVGPYLKDNPDKKIIVEVEDENGVIKKFSICARLEYVAREI